MNFDVSYIQEPDDEAGREWVWKNWIPHGQVTIFAGDSSVGKSRTLASLVTCVLKQEEFPDGEFPTQEPGYIFLVNTESDDREIYDTFSSQGCNSEDLKYLRVYRELKDNNGNTFAFDIDNPGHMAVLEKELKRWKPLLLVLDPLLEFHKRNTISDIAIRSLMIKLKSLAARYHVAIVAMIHWNKNEKQSNSNRIAGSHQFKAAVRAMVTVYRDAKNPDLRVFHQEKQTNGPEQGDLSFKIEAPDGLVIWGKKAVTGISGQSKVSQAEQWLIGLLKKFDVMPVAEIVKVSEFNERTLRQARHNLELEIYTRWIQVGPVKTAHWELRSDKNLWGLGKLSISSPGSAPDEA